MKISKFIEKLQEIQQEFGDVEMALLDRDTGYVQSLDVVRGNGGQLYCETFGDKQYCVIPGVNYWEDFL